jgi:hypothetical protein
VTRICSSGSSSVSSGYESQESEDNFGMRGKVFRQKRRKSFETSPVEMKGKITHSFAQQVAAFIRRYRPALEGLAKR